MPTYFQILTALISFAMANPAAFKRIWDLVVDTYQATLDMIEGVKAELPGALPSEPGTLELSAPALDEELDAEDRLAALLYPEGTQALRESGQFRKIIGWLMTSEIGKRLMEELFRRMGS